MSMKNQALLSAVMVLLSWLFLPVLGLRNIRRFLPAAILIVVLESINVQIGKQRKWWVFYNKPNSFIANEFPFNIGPFLIGSMFILKWTYGNFKLFILVNAIVDGTFAFLMTDLFKKAKIFTLVRFNKLQFFIYFFFKAFLLYGFQNFIERKKLSNFRTF